MARRTQGFRPTERVQAYLDRREKAGERKTDAINKAIGLYLDVAEATGINWVALRYKAEAEEVTPGTLLGRLALAGLKGAKR